MYLKIQLISISTLYSIVSPELLLVPLSAFKNTIHSIQSLFYHIQPPHPYNVTTSAILILLAGVVLVVARAAPLPWQRRSGRWRWSWSPSVWRWWRLWPPSVGCSACGASRLSSVRRAPRNSSWPNTRSRATWWVVDTGHWSADWTRCSPGWRLSAAKNGRVKYENFNIYYFIIYSV